MVCAEKKSALRARLGQIATLALGTWQYFWSIVLCGTVRSWSLMPIFLSCDRSASPVRLADGSLPATVKTGGPSYLPLG
jgi:hypothetical protein